MLDEAERLDRENGQHAWHQVQHEPTGDGQSQRSKQRDERRLTGFARRSRRGLHRESVARDPAVQALGNDQNALDRRGDCLAQRPPRDLELDAGGFDASSLWGRKVDRSPLRGIEPDVGDALGHQPRGVDRQPDVLGRGDERCLPWARRRNGPSGGRDELRPAGIWCRRAPHDRQRQRDGSLLGDADLLADEPARPRPRQHGRDWLDRSTTD